MRAVVYSEPGPSSVLRVEERPDPTAGPGEVVVRLERAGVNPTDWKFRAQTMRGFEEVVPGQDGAGTVEAIGDGVSRVTPGDRVWLTVAQHERPYGTAAELTVQSEARVARLPDDADADLGASLGVPAVTAHRALTAGEVTRLAPGALDGATVLVAGGAGAVGNAAIQLARWSGATVVTTVSSEEKAALARAAGAHHVVNYRTDDVVTAVRDVAPDGVDQVVEVSLVDNVAADVELLRVHGTVAYYADTGGADAAIPVRASFAKNLRLQGLILYTLAPDLLAAAQEDVTAAVAAGALRAGEDAGLPLHHYPLAEAAAAHDAVEQGTVGKVLLDLTTP
jgi:NADPH2:quinone reductase